MEKEDLFEKYCDIASEYLDSISYNDKKDYIVSVFSVLNNASEMHDDSTERTPDR